MNAIQALSQLSYGPDQRRCTCERRFRIWERRNLAPAGLASSGLTAAIVLLGVGHAEFVFVSFSFGIVISIGKTTVSICGTPVRTYGYVSRHVNS